MRYDDSQMIAVGRSAEYVKWLFNERGSGVSDEYTYGDIYRMIDHLSEITAETPEIIATTESPKVFREGPKRAEIRARIRDSLQSVKTKLKDYYGQVDSRYGLNLLHEQAEFSRSAEKRAQQEADHDFADQCGESLRGLYQEQYSIMTVIADLLAAMYDNIEEYNGNPDCELDEDLAHMHFWGEEKFAEYGTATLSYLSAASSAVYDFSVTWIDISSWLASPSTGYYDDKELLRSGLPEKGASESNSDASYQENDPTREYYGSVQQRLQNDLYYKGLREKGGEKQLLEEGVTLKYAPGQTYGPDDSDHVAAYLTPNYDEVSQYTGMYPDPGEGPVGVGVVQSGQYLEIFNTGEGRGGAGSPDRLFVTHLPETEIAKYPDFPKGSRKGAEWTDWAIKHGFKGVQVYHQGHDGTQFSKHSFSYGDESFVKHHFLTFDREAVKILLVHTYADDLRHPSRGPVRREELKKARAGVDKKLQWARGKLAVPISGLTQEKYQSLLEDRKTEEEKEDDRQKLLRQEEQEAQEAAERREKDLQILQEAYPKVREEFEATSASYKKRIEDIEATGEDFENFEVRDMREILGRKWAALKPYYPFFHKDGIYGYSIDDFKYTGEVQYSDSGNSSSSGLDDDDSSSRLDESSGPDDRE